MAVPSQAANSWTTLASTPSLINGGGSLVYPGTGDTIYAFAGNGQPHFFGYSIGRNVWDTATAAPGLVSPGAALVHPGAGDTVYAFQGGDRQTFWGYSISRNAWDTLAIPPDSVGSGGALAHVASDSRIYALRGNNSPAFWSYSITTRTWTVLASAPANVLIGSALVYPGAGDTLYALAGSSSQDFWAYSISGNAWTALANTPASIEDGASLTFPVKGDTIYAFRGSDATFLAYSLSRNEWTTMTASPTAVSSGGSLTHFADTIFALPGNGSRNFYGYTIQRHAGPDWYVNDNSKANDSYTAAAGSDSTGDGSNSAPFLRFDSALAVAGPGHTIYIDAGTFQETLVIGVDNLDVIGVDSGRTILDVSNALDSVIAATGRNGLTIRGLRVTGGAVGVHFRGVTGSAVESVLAIDNSAGVIFDSGADDNLIRNSTADSNAGAGIQVVASDRVLIEKSTATRNLDGGVWIETADSALLVNNAVVGNFAEGLLISGAEGGYVENNRITNNDSGGILLQNAAIGNRITGNQISANNLYQVRGDGLSVANTIAKNNIIPSAAFPDSGARFDTTGAVALGRNWWGVTDSTGVRARIVVLPGAEIPVYHPFRLGVLDTAALADTVAPRAPDTVAATGASPTSILVTYSPVSQNEEPHSEFLLQEYRIYRSRTPDTSYWAFRGTSGVLSFLDGGLAANDTWYYRVTTRDNPASASFINESFFSDSIILGAVIDTTPPSAPTSLTPADFHETRVNTIVFTWAASFDTGGVANYIVQIDTSIQFDSPIVDSTTTALHDTHTLIGETTYYWRVIAVDNSGNSTPSATQVITIDTAPPDSFAQTVPDDFHETRSTTIEFRWNVSADTTSGINRYVLQIDTVTSFSSLLVDSGTGLETRGVRTLAANDTYYWRVIAHDDAGNSRSSNTRTVHIDTMTPQAFALDTPVDGFETGVPFLTTPIDFRWGSSADSQSGLNRYVLQVDTSGTFLNLLVDSATGLETQGRRSFAADDTYYWRAVVFDDAGNTSATSPRSFMITTSAPLLEAPGYSDVTADTRPIFQWSLTSRNRFELQIADDSSFTVIRDTVATNSPTTAAQPDIALDSGVYYWRVIAKTANVPRETSAIGRVVIDTAVSDTIAPEAFQLDTPVADGETNEVTIIFRWHLTTDSGSGVKEYRLQADTSPVFGSPHAQVIVGPTTREASLELSGPDVVWYWRVLAVDGVGFFRASESRRIRIDRKASVSQVSPAAGAVQDSRPVLVWTGTSVETYIVEVDTQGTFAAPIETALLRQRSSYQPPVGLDSGLYYWRVIGFDTLANRDTTPARIVRIDTGTALLDAFAPDSFAATLPENAADTSANAITFMWNAAADTGGGVAQYRIQVDTLGTFGFFLIDSGVNAATNSGTVSLFGTDSYYWRIRAVDFAGNATVTSTRRITVDTLAPSAPSAVAPIGGRETSATTIRFDWTDAADAGAGIGGYTLQFARNDSSFSAPDLVLTHFGSSETTPAYLFSVADTWFWRVRAVDRAGNTGAFTAGDSFTRPALADTSAPLPVVDFAAIPLVSGAIALSWTRSPSTDAAQYVVFWDEGYGSALPESVLTSIPHTETTYSYSVSSTVHGTGYRFRVIAIDASGNQSSGAFTSAIARFGGPVFAEAVVTYPVTGSKLRLNDGSVLLLARLEGLADSIARAARLTFQYRLFGALRWYDMGATSGFTGNANPAQVGSSLDELGNYRFVWNTDGLRVDTYEVRIMVTNTTGETNNSAPAAVYRIIDPAVDSPSLFTAIGDTRYTLTSVLNVNRQETFALTNDADTQTAALFIPAGAFPSATDTANVFIVLSLYDSVPVDASLLLHEAAIHGALDISLSNGETSLAAGVSALVTLTYRDDNLDGLVDETIISKDSLRIFRHSGLAGGSWEELPIVERREATATSAGWVRARTTHFSVFRLVGAAASANLDQFMVVPNPYRPNDGNNANGRPYDGTPGSGIYFMNLPVRVELEIFTLTGRRVAIFRTNSSTGQIQWDVRNEAYQEVASGVYLYRVKDLITGQQAIGKFTVIR